MAASNWTAASDVAPMSAPINDGRPPVNSDGPWCNEDRTEAGKSVRRSNRKSVMLHKFDDYVVDGKVKYGINIVVNYSNLSVENFSFITSLNKSVEPRNFKEAMLDPKWVEAINTKIEALNRNKLGLLLFFLMPPAAASDVAATSAPATGQRRRVTVVIGGQRWRSMTVNAADHRSTVAVNDGPWWRTTVDCRWTTVDHHRTTGQRWLVGRSTSGPGPGLDQVWAGSGSGLDRVWVSAVADVKDRLHSLTPL
nr:putative reverse transcriptase, RNA-dependent DNA polymerase, Gag-polypeptide of LTR copia-type [Tanacetum cinerariifolium]